MKLKSFWLFLFFLLSSFFVYSNSSELTFMSFNIQGASPIYEANQHLPTDKKWVRKIAQSVKEANADIVLLQEVWIGEGQNPDMTFFNNIISYLNNYFDTNWNYKTTIDYAECHTHMHNAVIYNEKKVQFLQDKGSNDFFKLDKYKIHNNNTQVLIFSFNSVDFAVINVHLPGPNNSLLINARTNLSNIYNVLRGKYPIVIGGDFNTKRRELMNLNFKNGIVDGVGKGVGKKLFIDKQGQGTTLSLRTKKSGENIVIRNDFDHFIIHNLEISEEMRLVYYKDRKSASYRDEGNIYTYPIRLGGDVFKSSNEFQKKVSDHLPIMIKIKF